MAIVCQEVPPEANFRSGSPPDAAEPPPGMTVLAVLPSGAPGLNIPSILEIEGWGDLKLDNHIRKGHSIAGAHMRSYEQATAVTGVLLRERKRRCAHGQWGAWLAENFDGSQKTAYRYLEAAEKLSPVTSLTAPEDPAPAPVAAITTGTAASLAEPEDGSRPADRSGRVPGESRHARLHRALEDAGVPLDPSGSVAEPDDEPEIVNAEPLACCPPASDGWEPDWDLGWLEDNHPDIAAEVAGGMDLRGADAAVEKAEAVIATRQEVTDALESMEFDVSVIAKLDVPTVWQAADDDERRLWNELLTKIHEGLGQLDTERLTVSEMEPA